MADATYQPKVYREHGAARFVVASSGSLDVESGGEIDIESGGNVDIGGTAFITTGGKVDLSSGAAFVKDNVYATGILKTLAGVVEPVETLYTTGTVSSYGITVITTSSGQLGAGLTIAPVAGVRKTLIIQSSVTSAQVVITTTGTWDGTNSVLTIATTSGATETRIDAVATSTARWRLLWVTASSNYALT